jgi:hypothetical protein
MLSCKTATTGTTEAVQQDVLTQPLVNLLPNDRRALALGPKINIYVGDKLIGSFPKKALMALSSTLKFLIDKHPTVSGIMLNPGEVSVEDSKILLGYIDRVVRAKHSFTVAPLETIYDTVHLYRNALAYGMEPYVGQLVASQLKYATAPDIVFSKRELEAIIQLPTNNRLYEITVRRCEGFRYNPVAFEEFLGQHAEFEYQVKAQSLMRQQQRDERREANQQRRDQQRRAAQTPFKLDDEDFPPWARECVVVTMTWVAKGTI